MRNSWEKEEICKNGIYYLYKEYKESAQTGYLCFTINKSLVIYVDMHDRYLLQRTILRPHGYHCKDSTHCLSLFCKGIELFERMIIFTRVEPKQQDISPLSTTLSLSFQYSQHTRHKYHSVQVIILIQIVYCITCLHNSGK